MPSPFLCSPHNAHTSELVHKQAGRSPLLLVSIVFQAASAVAIGPATNNKMMDVIREVIASSIFGTHKNANLEDMESNPEPESKRKQIFPFRTVDILGHVHDNPRFEDEIFKNLGNAFLALEPSPVYSNLCPLHDNLNLNLVGEDKLPFALTLPKPMFTTNDRSDMLENLMKISESCNSNSNQERRLPKYRIPAANIIDITGIDIPKILSDISDVLFPTEYGIRAELVEMIILQPMAPFSYHEEIQLGANDIGGIEIILPSLYLGGWVEMHSPIRRSCELSSYKFFDDRVYEKMKAKESGYTSENVIKFSTPNQVFGIFAWNQHTVFGPTQILAGVRMSLLYKISRLESVTSVPSASPNALYMPNHAQQSLSSNQQNDSTAPTHIAMANSTSSAPSNMLPSTTQPTWIIRTNMAPKVTEYYNYTVRELKSLCRDLHLSCSGTKDELVGRLLEKESLRCIGNCLTFNHDITIKFAVHFAQVLLSALRNDRFIPDPEANFRLAFPCRHLYEREQDLPALLKIAENPSSVKTSQLFLKGADAVLAAVATHAGLKTRMIRVGCIEIHSPTELSAEATSAGNHPWQNTSCYFPFPFLPVIRSIPELLSIEPMVVANRLIPVLTLTDTTRVIAQALGRYNAKGEKNIPLESLHWAVNLPRVSNHHTVCLPSFMPLQFISPSDESVHHQSLIPEALMYESYIRLSASKNELYYRGRIFFHCAMVMEIPGVGSEERSYCIDTLSSWLSSASMHQAIDVVRAGHNKEVEENNAAYNFQTDLTRYTWLDIQSAQKLAQEYDVDTHGTTKAIMNRLSSRIASMASESLPQHQESQSQPIAENHSIQRHSFIPTASQVNDTSIPH